MSEIWLPPSARSATTQLGDGIEVTPMDGESLDRVLGPDDAIFIRGDEWGIHAFEPGEDIHGREAIPWVGIDFERLRQRCLDGTALAEVYGVNEGLGTADGTVIPFPDGPQLYVRLDDCHLYVGPVVGKAPDGWLEAAMADGFMLSFAPLPDGRCPWLATGPMSFQGRIMLPPVSRGRATQVGRNQPCPCGSELKFKRCCGR